MMSVKAGSLSQGFSLSQGLWGAAQYAAGFAGRVAGAVTGTSSTAELRRSAAEKLYEVVAGRVHEKGRQSIRDADSVSDVPTARAQAIAVPIAIPIPSAVAVEPVSEPNPPVEGRLVIAIQDRLLYQTNSPAERLPAESGDDRDMPMEKGKMWELIRRLLALNRHDPSQRLVEIIIFSRGSSQTFRLDNSLDDPAVGLDIGRALYLGDDPIHPYLNLVGAHLFITDEKDAAAAATAAGLAAVHVPESAPAVPPIPDNEAAVLSLDFDGVVGDRMMDLLFKKEGLPAVLKYEQAHRDDAMAPGPLFGYAVALTELKETVRAALRKREEYRDLPESEFNEAVTRRELKIAMVTARAAGLNGRRPKLTMFDTLRKVWRVACDRYLSLGYPLTYVSPTRLEKGPFLRQMGVHLHVDDSAHHVGNSIEHGITPGHVVYPDA